MVYSTTGFVAGLCQLSIMKYGSAALMTVITAVTLPLTEIAFSLEIFMGDAAEPFTGWSIGGLAFVVLGMCLYTYFGSEVEKDRKHREAVEEAKEGGSGRMADSLKDIESDFSDNDEPGEKYMGDYDRTRKRKSWWRKGYLWCTTPALPTK